ncbi:MAG: hypothetical protein ACOYD0_02100 [Candidatus Nanopelagicales bacterium]
MAQSSESQERAPVIPSSMDLTCRALAHVLDISPTNLRADTPLADIGADSVALIVFADVALGFGAHPGAPRIRVDNGALRVAATVGDLSGSITVSQS